MTDWELIGKAKSLAMWMGENGNHGDAELLHKLADRLDLYRQTLREPPGELLRRADIEFAFCDDSEDPHGYTAQVRACLSTAADYLEGK